MKAALHPIGTVRTVYARVGTATETCDLGCKHRVEYYAVKRIRVVLVKTGIFIKGLHYTHDGYGNQYHAVDAQGREYWCRDTWDGPSVWHRDGDRLLFMSRPSGEVRKDANGRLLK